METLGARFKISSRFLSAAILAGVAYHYLDCGTALATPAASPTPASSQMMGVTNFHQVNEHIYRGAQPTAAGFQSLAKLGVKTIIDLREADGRSALEKKLVEGAGMRYINIPLRGMSAPSPADVAKVMALFNEDSAGPVFVHCRRGADRTGTVVACYRIAHDGWDNAKALQEAKTDGMRWVEVAMQRYVLNYHAPAAASGPPAAATAPQQ
jgi:tyrosine-protein phosphatase SIW14